MKKVPNFREPDYYRRVLDWQLDLLDLTQLHTITMYTLHNSQQLSLFSSSEDYGSNSATTAATNSYGIPCHYSLTAAAPLSNTKLLNYLLTPALWPPTSGYRPGADHKENPSPIPVLLELRHYRNGPQRKRWSLPLLRCMATACKQASYCWLLTYSVHVTIYCHVHRNQPLALFDADNSVKTVPSYITFIFSLLSWTCRETD
jgi:hypothetical protein